MELGGATALPCCRPRSEALTSPSSFWWSPAGAASAGVLPEFLMCPTSSPAADAGNYTAPGVVLAILGVKHDELVSIAEPPLPALPGVKRHEESKSMYMGGDYRCQADSPDSWA